MKSKFTFFSFLFLTALFISSCCEEQIWYADTDSDGFGDANTTTNDCEAPVGFVADNTDIDDTDADLNPNTVWQGAVMAFTKMDSADWTLAENQDRITDNVWLTRTNDASIFNIKTESSYDQTVSPADTEWAIGSISDGIKSLTFDTWKNTNGANKPTIDQNMVLHLISDNIYIDIKFTSWAVGTNGGQGGFAYERSTSNE